MNRKLGALVGMILTVSMLLAFSATPVFAACSDAKITAYSMEDYWNTNSEAPLVTCYNSGRSNLENNDYDPEGSAICPRYWPALPPGSLSWNDCISSYKVVIANCHVGIRLYVNSGFSGTMYTHWGSYNRPNMVTTVNNDAVSSIGFLYRSQCPLFADL